MNIPAFTLPSNSEITVRLREATVSDAIDFSEIDKSYEEEAITTFLNCLQLPESKTDSRHNTTDSRLWTGEDRRYALFVYLLNTSKFPDTPVTYHCDLCDKDHTVAVVLAGILDQYRTIEGASFREFPHDGHNVIVHPFLGRDLESLELLRGDLNYQKELLKSATGAERKRDIERAIRKRTTHISMYSVLARIDMPGLGDADLGIGLDELSRRPLVEECIKKMAPTEFEAFFAKVKGYLSTMKHGLNMSVGEDGQLHLITPLVHCENHPESDGVVLRFQFRTWNIIPYI